MTRRVPLVISMALSMAYADVRHASIAAESSEPPKSSGELAWLDNYAAAYDLAKQGGKMLLINFVPASGSRAQAELDSALQENPVWHTKLEPFVRVRIGTDHEIQVAGKPVTLLHHGAFREMHGNAGIAIVDLVHEGAPYYGRVVTALPFTSGKYYRWQTNHFAAALELPAGTITQRTMVWAVRTHPERPSSTVGEPSDVLLSAARTQSQHQANIGVQGHHNWDSRFHRIRSRLGFGMPVEVVAESWPGQTMLDSCIDCVQSWRHSPGHWRAVRNAQAKYGYDIRRGRNGIWYGTGIFVR